MAAAEALANLAKEKVPKEVLKAYGGKAMSFGREYLIPTPFDPRLIYTVSKAVAKAAIDSGVARKPIEDWDAYDVELRNRGQRIISADSKSDLENQKNSLVIEGGKRRMYGFPRL